ncbi:hypothetical protein CASFOL_018288 [Castilleja foliolosa]|uniref:Uncharacterized protein n=1 Tax=Castilleja foliolosa TaxID=1961234 RepID=A0ABD3DAB4_9LAMI
MDLVGMSEVRDNSTGTHGPSDGGLVRRRKCTFSRKAHGSVSPSPRSLPIPSFFNKKQQINDDDEDNLATRDLRRMLRLE